MGASFQHLHLVLLDGRDEKSGFFKGMNCYEYRAL